MAYTGNRNATDIDRAVGEKICIYRRAKSISQKDLADALGVTYQQVQKYENGTDRISAGRLRMVADALDMPIEKFFEPTLSKSMSSSSIHAVAECARSIEIMDSQMRDLAVELLRTMAMSSRARSAPAQAAE